MERMKEREPGRDSKEEMLAEIAEVMNVPVSRLQQEPPDVRNALCCKYVCDSTLGKDELAAQLNSILNLDVDSVGVKPTEKRQEPEQQDKPEVDREVSQKEKVSRQNNRTGFVLTRAQFLENARIIAEKQAAQSRQQQVEHQEQMSRTSGYNGN